MIRSSVRVTLAALLVAFALVAPAEAARDRVPLFQVSPGSKPLGQLPSLAPPMPPLPPDSPPFRSCFALGMGGPSCDAKPDSCLVRQTPGRGPCGALWRPLLIHLGR